ncbi:MAG: NUDIX hydrolase [Minwuia sp.]|uniref:NUDIX hydrolase n=1 Tax=Minwuia sp. TaxID=2493630 RepID=UPI003A8C2DF3
MDGPDLTGKFADVVPKPASSILLVRDGETGLEVFMVTRHHQIDFASGAMVFPGGKVDAADSDASVRQVCIGAEALDDTQLGFRIAAIREAFEETGVLLASGHEGEDLGTGRYLALKETYAADMEANRVTMGEMAERERLMFDLRMLQPFAHWITPAVLPKRFDTPFYMAEIPESQSASALHDGTEAVESVWINPAEAVRRADAKEVTMVFATRLNLIKLSRANSVAEAMSQAREDPLVPVTPKVYAKDGRRFIDIPAEAGFGGPTFDVGAAG